MVIWILNIMASVVKILMIVHFERSFSRSWPGPNVIQVGVKSLFMSKFTHILLALPNPSEAIFKEIDEIFAKFIWQNKPSKFRKEILEAPYDKGALQLMNLKKFCNSLKLSWISRIFQSDGKWTCFPAKYQVTDLAVFGVNKALTWTHSLSNLFSKDLGKAKIELLKTCHPKCLREVLS